MSAQKRIKELLTHRACEKCLDCLSAQNKVLAYIRTSKKERKAYNSVDVTDAFAHIYWCINTTPDCGNVWRTLKFVRQYPGSPIEDGIVVIATDPAILKGCDKEIQALLSKWESEIQELERNAFFEDLPDPPVGDSKNLLN